jgi:PAS domain S-box-containing protein
VYWRRLVPFKLTAPVAFRRGIPLIYASLAVAGLISCGALVGWWAGLPLLTSWGPDFVTMKPVSVVAILLIAFAILPQFQLAPRWRIAIGVIAALLGASSLIQEYGRLDLGLESWLAPAGAAPGPTSADFLMSPATAVAVLFAGTAITLLPFPRLADIVRFLAAGVGVIGATAFLGYLLGVDALYSFPPYSSVSLPAAIAFISLSAALLTHAQSSSPARRGDWRVLLSQFFAPLLIFSLFTWWSWRTVEADARADAERTVESLSQYAQRVFEIQETALEAVVHLVKGRDAADIAIDHSMHEFLSEIEKQTPTSDAIILVTDSGRLISWSRGFPTPDVDVSQRDYFKAHRGGEHGTYIGEVISTAPFGAVGFTMSRRDPGTGIIAVAHIPIDSFMRHSGVQVSQRDALMLARADGTALVTNLPLADPIGFQLPETWPMSLLIRGEFTSGKVAPAGLDGVKRLWQVRKVAHYPVYQIYGLDAVLIDAAWLHEIIPFGLLAFFTSALTYSLSRLWRTTQERLATIVTSSADAIISKTPDGIVTSWNEAAERMFGYPASEMIGQSIRRLIPADRQQEEDMMLACLARGERLEHYETARVAKDGRTIDVSVTVSPMRDAAGCIVGSSKIVRDVTARKQAEQLLRRQADLLDQSHDAIFTWKIGGGIAYWSRGAELLYGYTAEEAIGQISHELLRTRSPVPTKEVEAQIAREGSWYGELTHTTRDGRTIVVESRHVRVCYDGEIYALETSRDITARKQAQAERQKFVSLADRSSEFIGMCDLDFKPFYVNEAGRRLVGLDSLEQACTTPVQDFFFPEDRDYITNQFFPKVLDEGHAEVEIRFRHFKTGAVLWMIYNVFEVTGEAGQPVGYATVSRDVTARKQAEAQLAEREAQLALFVKYAPAAIAMFDDKMRYLAVSRCFLSDYRLPPDAEIIGRSHYEVFPETPQRWRDLHARVLAGEELSHEEEPFPRQDGRIDRVQWSMKPWRTADGRIGGVLLFSQLMTRALAEKEARFQATFENAAVGIAHVAPDGRWLRVNEALCRILDYPADELITKSFKDVTYPDDLAVDLADRKRMLDGEIDKYAADKRFLRKDGSIVWVRLTVGCVREGEGSIDYLVCAVEDISARKHAEEAIHLVMRESNHRVKNLLGLVQAIARQTAAHDPQDFVRLFSERIQALAANQDMLVRNEWRGIDAEELARTQLAHFADLVGSRIVLHGPRLRLNATAAQAIGLALHELATNAGKYGALSANAGRVDLQWRRKGGIFTMSWTERNGPLVSPPQRRGFGSTVVDSMVKLSVGGTVELNYAPSGLVWRLVCPAANALEPPDREQTPPAGENRSGGGSGKVKERLTA